MKRKGREIDEKVLLRYMEKEAGRPLSFAELAETFGVRRSERPAFRGKLRGMLTRGLLVKTRRGRYGVASHMNLVTGSLTCHPDGYGFVVPEGGGEDVFIGPRKLGGAMHGDTVVARVESYRGDGKREGRIIRIVKRANSTVVGRIEKGKRFSVLIPSNERILDRIIIPPREAKGAPDGVIVEAEITRWPAKNTSPAGRVVSILGDPEDPDVEAEVTLKKFGLPVRFTAPVMREAKKVPRTISRKDLDGRVDLRTRTIFTIDGETARDFDDAVGIEKTPRWYRLFVSIADVSRYVTENSLLDAEALSRGTSVYFPDRCIPMLPEALSNGICSLRPGEDRLTVTVEMDFDITGALCRKKFYRSVIRSVRRFTYSEVRDLLAEGAKKEDPLLEDLKTMEDLCRLLVKKRAAMGSIDFDLPEPQIIINLSGRIEDIVRSERNIAHRIIEEFMLAANRAVAEEFATRALPFLYRVHEAPDEESLNRLREFLASLGLTLRGRGPRAFQRIVRAVEGRPEERVVNHMLLRAMKQARYSDENIGHFGLAFRDYTHFTSPIRRYPDLVVHRLLKLLMDRKYSKRAQERMKEILPAIAASTSASERKAMDAERDITDLKKAQFMKDKVGLVYDGYISGVTSFGLFVELKEYFVEGLVHVSTLVDDYYVYDEKRHVLIGEHTNKTFRIGDPVKVRIERVDLATRRIDMALQTKEAPGRKRAGRRRR